MKPDRILREGRNCWRICRSSRVSFLVDGEAYFAALADAVEQARHSVLILGWDIDSRIRLRRNGGDDGQDSRLGSFLNRVAANRKDLHVYILDWDFVMLYAFEREPLPVLNLGWRAHRRVHFALDDRHPVGASHHQKIVVVDDKVAFAGGMDLAACRWDTPDHTPGDDRRNDTGVPYPPFHDVQMMVDGETAAALGELARKRWFRATGEILNPPGDDSHDPWPSDLVPDLEDAAVAISRTEPSYNGCRPVQEVMRLYLDAFAAARECIYIENQYLTAAVMEAAIASRLRERTGPEIIMVFPRECSGWMEESTMGILRGRFLRKLRDADQHGRLRIYYPSVEGLENEVLNVHSKVLVVDDDLLRIGSANLTNRSMGVDTECDLALEAAGDERMQAAIRRFRNGLLAEHLGRNAEDVEAALEKTESLSKAVEDMRGGPHTLVPFAEQTTWIEPLIPDASLIDPEKPLYLEEAMEQFIPEQKESRRKAWNISYRGILFLTILGIFLMLGAAWRWTPLGDWLDLSALWTWIVSIRHSPAAPLAVMAVFVLGGLIMFPVTLMILATAVAFETLAGFSYALLGSLTSAMTTYALGRFLGQEKVWQITGPRLKKIHRQLIRRGMLTMTIIRYLPVAPFSIVNLIAGAAHIRVIDFFFGTAFGMAPGILAINVFERSLSRAIRSPDPQNLLLLGGVIAGLLTLFWLLRRWIGRKQFTGAE